MIATAAVLAGGLGTRLRPAVGDRPKVLAPVAGRPFVAHLLDRLDAAGVRRVVLLTGHRAGEVRARLGTRHGGMGLAYSEEPAPLGTGGALRLAWPHLDAPTVLLLNGDSYCGLNVKALTAFHRRRGAGVSMALVRVDDAGRFGRVRTAGGRVTAFAEKQGPGLPGWINAGVYLIGRGLVESIPAGRPVSLERKLLPAWVAQGRVFAHRSAGPFLDIGTPGSYAEAEGFFRNVAGVSRPVLLPANS